MDGNRTAGEDEECGGTYLYRFLIAPGNGGCGADIRRVNWYDWFDKEMTARGHECICVDWPDPYRCHQSVWLPFAAEKLNLPAAGVSSSTSPPLSSAPCASTNDDQPDDTQPDQVKIVYRNIVVGHSTGALLVLRMLETFHQGLFGAILVSAAHTDLDDEGERASGFFDTPWAWDKIALTATSPTSSLRFIHQFHSDDDHLIPVDEARYVALQIRTAMQNTMTATRSSQENENNDDTNANDTDAHSLLHKGQRHGRPPATFEYEELTDYGHFFDPFQPLLDAVDKYCT